jgi:hypothetical protein
VTLVLFGAFGVLSLVFWAWFRFRPQRTGLPGPSAGPPEDQLVSVPAPAPAPAVVS